MSNEADKLNRRQTAIVNGVWKLIEDYATQRQCRINGPDPSLDAAEELLKMTIENLVKKAVE